MRPSVDRGDPEGRKELLGSQTGFRENAQNWRELLLDLKGRGLTIPPELAIGDGALGFAKALDDVFPKTRRRRCWVHKTANVLKVRREGPRVRRGSSAADRRPGNSQFGQRQLGALAREVRRRWWPSAGCAAATAASGWPIPCMIEIQAGLTGGEWSGVALRWRGRKEQRKPTESRPVFDAIRRRPVASRVDWIGTRCWGRDRGS